MLTQEATRMAASRRRVQSPAPREVLLPGQLTPAPMKVAASRSQAESPAPREVLKPVQVTQGPMKVAASRSQAERTLNSLAPPEVLPSSVQLAQEEPTRVAVSRSRVESPAPRTAKLGMPDATNAAARRAAIRSCEVDSEVLAPTLVELIESRRTTAHGNNAAAVQGRPHKTQAKMDRQAAQRSKDVPCTTIKHLQNNSADWHGIALWVVALLCVDICVILFTGKPTFRYCEILPSKIVQLVVGIFLLVGTAEDNVVQQLPFGRRITPSVQALRRCVFVGPLRRLLNPSVKSGLMFTLIGIYVIAIAAWRISDPRLHLREFWEATICVSCLRLFMDIYTWLRDNRARDKTHQVE